MSQGWYYTQRGQQMGPVEFGHLQQLAAAGQIGPTDLVWCEGMATWAPASTIGGLTTPAPYGGAAPTGYDPTQAQYAAAPGYPASPYGAQAGLNYYSGGQNVQYEYAGFWLRFVAALLDGIISGIVTLPISITVIVACGGILEYQRNPSAQALLQIVGLVVGWLYFALQESGSAQATLGKRALGLVVITLSGQRIGFGQATGRYFGKILSYLICCFGFFMAGWTQQKQGLHDMMAGTLVVVRR